MENDVIKTDERCEWSSKSNEMTQWRRGGMCNVYVMIISIDEYTIDECVLKNILLWIWWWRI